MLNIEYWYTHQIPHGGNSISEKIFLAYIIIALSAYMKSEEEYIKEFRALETANLDRS